MITRTSNEVPYDEKDEKTETESSNKESKRSSTEGILKPLSEAILNMAIPKLFLILSMAIYGVIAYSKKEAGVETDDLSLFIFFILFIIVVFIILTVFKYLWNFISMLKIKNRVETLYGKNLKDYLKILFIFPTIILLLVIFKFQIINFVRFLINAFVNFKL
jgi:hypothetical protein